MAVAKARHIQPLPEQTVPVNKIGLVIGGGIVPDEDVPYLQEKGISAVFGPGTSIKELSEYIREKV